MHHSHPSPRLLCRAALAVAAAWTAGLAAGAEVATYFVEREGAARVAAVQTQEIDGVDYVPLLDLVQQFGGGYNLLFSRAQVDLGSRSAYVLFNEREVDASGSRFSLRRPIVRTEGNVMIARSDVAVFFQNAFRLAVQAGSGPTVSVPITPREPDPAADLVAPGRGALAAAPEVKDRKIRTVVLDPGHGGLDRGATGRTGLQENELAMAVAKAMRDVLRNAGFQVVLTREENTNLSISERAKLANDKGGDLLVSIHAGTSFAPNAHGVELFYPTLGLEADSGSRSGHGPPASREHAYVQRSQQFAHMLAGAVRDATSADVRGVHGARLRLHKTAAMPGVMIEIGMLSNQADEALLEQDSYRQGIAQGLLQAIEQFNEQWESS